MDLSKTGLDATAQVAVEAMSTSHDAKDWAKCVAVGDAWIEARGSMPLLCSVWYAQSLLSVGRVPEALAWSKLAAETMPSDQPLGVMSAKGCYAQVLAATGQFAKARRILKELVRAPHDDPEAQEKLGHIALAVTDKWAKGWALHEGRIANRPYPPNCTPWDGVTQTPVVVLHEQGIGDAVLFARWLDWLEQASGHKPVWLGPKLLHRWIGDGHAVGSIDDYAQEEQLTALYAMSLPHAAQVTTPRRVVGPYAPPSLLTRRAERRFNADTLTVGVCWRGADWNYHNFERSYDPEDFATIWQPIDGVEFVNLCHDADVPDGAPFGRRMFSDVYETGETVSQLDLVVSVDTAIVHIAGSLGVPTLALLPTKLDWRYQWPFGCESPFYASVTTVRRPTSTDLGALPKARTMLDRWVRDIRKRVAA